jgi:PBSX family phage terminase large subunit
MQLSPAQIRSISNTASRINLWHGPVRTGKTIASIVRWLRYVEADAPTGGDLYMIGRTFASLRRNVIMPMEELVGADWHYYPGKGFARLWGRNIHVLGGHDAKSEYILRGSTSAGTYIDEATTIPESLFKMALTRLSLRGSRMYGTTNPDNPRHYLKTEYLDRSEELGISEWSWPLDENPFLPQEYIDALKMEFGGLFYKRFILGEWCAAEGAIYSMFDDGLHKLDGMDEEPDEYIVAIDIGTSVPTCFLLIGIKYSHHGRPTAWVEREYYHDPAKTNRQKTDSQHAQDLVTFTGTPRHRKVPIVAFYCDPAAANFRAECKECGILSLKDIDTADNEVKPGIETVSSMLQQGRLRVFSQCVNLLTEISAYVWDPKRQEVGQDVPVKKNDHAVDALRYGIHSHLGDMTGAVALASAWGTPAR